MSMGSCLVMKPRKGTSPPMNEGEHGFSLAEIMVAVVLLLLFAALTVPSLTTALNAWQLNADARKISTTLMSAKLRTTSQATRYRVHFDVPNNSFNCQRFNRTTGNYVDIADESAVTLSDGISNSGIRLTADSPSGPTGFPTTSSEFIIFNSRGIPVDNGGVPTGDNVIYLSNSSTSYAVTVSQVGRIQLWKLDGSQWVTEPAPAP